MICEIRLTNVSAEEMTKLLPLFEGLAKDEGGPIPTVLKAETEAPAKVRTKTKAQKDALTSGDWPVAEETAPTEKKAACTRFAVPPPTVAPIKEETHAEEEPKAEEPKKTSMTEVRFALSKVKEKYGASVVRDLLGKYDVKSFTEVPEEKYTALFEDAMEIYGKEEA